jgi:glycosyltransferase involved in cell wall biosynthesis
MKPDLLNICMYTPTAFGGHARYTHELLSAMSEVGQNRGVRVSLVSSNNLDSKYRTSLYPIYDILPPLLPRETFKTVLSWGFSRVFHYYRRERTFLRWIEEHDICEGIHFHEYAIHHAPQHFRLLKARGKYLFLTVHNVYPHVSAARGTPAPFYTLDLSIRRDMYRLCDALFVHEESLREELAAYLGEGHPPIFVTPHGVWSSASITGAEASFEKHAKRRLLFFGAIRPNKGLHVLLRALRRLTDCKLTVAGAPDDARYQKQIRELVEQMSPDRVELIDRFIEDDEVTELFEQSSLVILPYTAFAAQSGVLHDALAYGLPVVATDVGALGDSVRHWGIGQVVAPNDDAALASAIREILTPHRYTEACRAVERARRQLSWDRCAEITIEAYRSICRSEPRASGERCIPPRR